VHEQKIAELNQSIQDLLARLDQLKTDHAADETQLRTVCRNATAANFKNSASTSAVAFTVAAATQKTRSATPMAVETATATVSSGAVLPSWAQLPLAVLLASAVSYASGYGLGRAVNKRKAAPAPLSA